MDQIMRGAGWAKNEAEDVIGFQHGNNVYVLGSTPWTVFHELLHRSGINADRMNRYVAEGLVEAIAFDLKQAPDEHQPTYPEETAWIRGQHLPKLGMNSVELGRILASSDDPVRRLADLLVARDPGLDRSQLIEDLKPQRPNAPVIHSKGSVSRATEHGRRPRLGSARRIDPSPSSGSTDTTVESISAILILAGVALGLPAALRKLQGDPGE
jgi:hypothetical protein